VLKKGVEIGSEKMVKKKVGKVIVYISPKVNIFPLGTRHGDHQGWDPAGEIKERTQMGGE